jgi:hypothetical protein
MPSLKELLAPESQKNIERVKKNNVMPYNNPQVPDLIDHDTLDMENGKLTPEQKTAMSQENKQTPESKYKPMKPWLVEKLQAAGIEVNEFTMGHFDHEHRKVTIQQKNAEGKILYKITKKISELDKKIGEIKKNTKKPIGMSNELHKKTNNKSMSPESFKPQPKKPGDTKSSPEEPNWGARFVEEAEKQEALEAEKPKESLDYLPVAGSAYYDQLKEINPQIPETAVYRVRDGHSLELNYKHNGRPITVSYGLDSLAQPEKPNEEKADEAPQEEKVKDSIETPDEGGVEDNKEQLPEETLAPIVLDEDEMESEQPANPEGQEQEPDQFEQLRQSIEVSRNAFAVEYAQYKQSKTRSEGFETAKKIYTDNKNEYMGLIQSVGKNTPEGRMMMSLEFLQKEQNDFERAVMEAQQQFPEKKNIFQKGFKWMSDKYNNLSPLQKQGIKYATIAGTAAIGTLLNPTAGVVGTLGRMALGTGIGALTNEAFKTLLPAELIEKMRGNKDRRVLERYSNDPVLLQKNLAHIEKNMRKNKATAEKIRYARAAAQIGTTVGITLLATGKLDAQSINETIKDSFSQGAEWLQQIGDSADSIDTTLPDNVLDSTPIEQPNITVPAEPFEVVQPEGTFDIPQNGLVPTPDQITLDQLDGSTLEAELAPKGPDAFVATPENIPQEAYVEAGSGEGFTHLIRDQIMADPQLAEQLGFEGGDLKKFAQSKAWEIAQAQGYENTGLAPYGDNKIAYVLDVNDGKAEVIKFLNGEQVSDLSKFEYTLGKSGASVDVSGLQQGPDGAQVDVSGLQEGPDGAQVDVSGLQEGPDASIDNQPPVTPTERMALNEIQGWMDKNYDTFLDTVREKGTDGVMQINGKEIPFKQMYIDNPSARIIVGEYRGNEFTMVQTIATDASGNQRAFHILDLDNDGFIDRIGFNLTQTGDNSYLMFESERALEKKIIRGSANTAMWGDAEIVDFDPKNSEQSYIKMNPSGSEEAVSKGKVGEQAINNQQEHILNEYKKIIDRTLTFDDTPPVAGAEGAVPLENQVGATEPLPQGDPESLSFQDLSLEKKVGIAEKNVLDSIFEANVERNRGINAEDWVAIKDESAQLLLETDAQKITNENYVELQTYFNQTIAQLAQNNITLLPEANESVSQFLRRAQETIITNNVTLKV